MDLGGAAIFDGFSSIFPLRLGIVDGGLVGARCVSLIFHEGVVLRPLALVSPGITVRQAVGGAARGLAGGAVDLLAYAVASESGLDLDGRTFFGLQGRC